MSGITYCTWSQSHDEHEEIPCQMTQRKTYRYVDSDDLVCRRTRILTSSYHHIELVLERKTDGLWFLITSKGSSASHVRLRPQ